MKRFHLKQKDCFLSFMPAGRSRQSVTALQEYTSDGAARIKASLIELENFKYIERFRDRKSNGRIGSVKITATPTREAEEK